MCKKPTYEELEKRVKELEKEAAKRKQVEQTLQESEERYKLLFENSGSAIAYYNTDRNMVLLNSQAAKNLGGEAKDFIGKSISVVPPKEAAGFLNQRLTKIIKEGKGDRFEDSFELLTGKYWFSSDLQPVRDESGNTRGVQIISNDITGRKLAEQALKESEEKYRTILESIEEGYYEVDIAGNLTFFNDSMCRILGYPKDELMGMNNRQYMDKENAEKVYQTFNKVYNTGEPDKGFDWEFLRKDGTKRHVEASVLLVKDAEGQPIGFRGIARDITEQKLAEEQKKRLETQLQHAQRMEAIGTLAGGIAHDFNNILYPIIGYTEMTMDDVPEESVAQANLREVLKAAERAKGLVHQILSFSRQREQERKPLRIQPIIKEVLKLLRASFPSTIEITQNIDEECGSILADPIQIHQVMMNLCTNAYQAMRDKGGVLEVALTEVDIGSGNLDSNLDLNPGPYLRLTVSDTGHGMDRLVMERIFDPYFTTKGPGDGTGMGLAVVHGTVKSYAGDMTVYSEREKGTTFHLYLPRIDTGAIGSETISTEPAPKGTERILFVDDEEQIVRMVQQMLERLGYHVTARTSSVEALEAFRAQPNKFDLVITDLTMPNMTGSELAPKLLEIRPDIPIILCTGFSEVITEDKGKAIGIREYLMKPVVKSEIAKSIRRVLDQEIEN